MTTAIAPINLVVPDDPPSSQSPSLLNLLILDHDRFVREARREAATSLGYRASATESVELALSRVAERVSRGGHDVPEPVIRRRFDRSIGNFLVHYRQLADVWMLFDNSGATPKVVASKKGEEVRIMDKGFFNALVKRYGHA